MSVHGAGDQRLFHAAGAECWSAMAAQPGAAFVQGDYAVPRTQHAAVIMDCRVSDVACLVVGAASSFLPSEWGPGRMLSR